MSTIYTDYGSGGAGLTPQAGSQRHPPLATVLRDVATDLASIRAAHNAGLAGLDIAAADPAAISAGALAAFTDPPSAAEMANTRTLVNELRTTAIANRTLLLEIKTDLNAITPGAVTSADPAAISAGALAAFTDPPSAAEMAALRTLVNEIRTTEIANRALAIEIKGDVNAPSFGSVGTLLTVAG